MNTFYINTLIPLEENIKKKYSLAGRISALILILFLTSFIPSNLFPPIIILAGFSLLLISTGKIKTNFLNMVIPLLGIFILGVIGVIGNEYHHIFRDIAYSLTPISLIYIGFWLGSSKKMYPKFFEILIIGGIIISVIHLLKFIPHPELFNSKISIIRTKASNPNVELVGFSLILVIFQSRLKMGNLFSKFLPRYIAISLLLLSFVLSFSRTYLILAIVMSLSIMGFIGRINLRNIAIVTFLLVSFAIIVITTPQDDVVTFRGKMARSLTELFSTKYKTYEDLIFNWRGYETHRALTTFSSGNAKHKIVGHGFGSLVDLGITMELDGTDYKKIPVLHNGYAYVLVKTGVLGLLLYGFFYFSLLRYSSIFRNSLIQEQVILSRLLLGCTLGLMFAMYVIGGMAEIHNSVYVLILGFILCQMEQF